MLTARKKAPAGVPDQARATTKNHYYNNISNVVFTSGVLCPICKRGHLHSKSPSKIFRVYKADGGIQWMAKKVMTCDRCERDLFLPAVAIKPIVKPAKPKSEAETNTLSRVQRQEIMDIIRKEFARSGMTPKELKAKAGLNQHVNISLFMSGRIAPWEHKLKLFCQALNIEWRWS